MRRSPPSLLRWLLAYPIINSSNTAWGSTASGRWIRATTASLEGGWRQKSNKLCDHNRCFCIISCNSTPFFASSSGRTAFISTTAGSSSSAVTSSFGGGIGWLSSREKQTTATTTTTARRTRSSSSSAYLFSTTKRHQNQNQQQQQSFSSSSQHQHYNNNNNNIITSTSSNTVKRFVALQTKRKKRKEAQETVVEGPRMVLDLLKNAETKHLIRQIIISTDIDDDIQQELNKYLLQDTTSESTIMVQQALPNILKACCDTVTPQGIVARVAIPNWDIENDIVNKKTRQHQQAPLYLILDGVSDPGNVGTLLRSSVACGVSAVILLPGCCDIWNPKAVRSSMGGSFLIPTFTYNSWEETLHELQSQQQDSSSLWDCRQFYAATMLNDDDDDDDDRDVSSPSSFAHYDINWKEQPQALIIGNEGNGLSAPIRKSLLVDKTIKAVHVPMEGTIESLNAAVCGSVILFEYMRQSRQQQS